MLVEFHKQSYLKGYDAAFIDMIDTTGSAEHTQQCGECRSCEVVNGIVNSLITQLIEYMDHDEYSTFLTIMYNVRVRRNLAEDKDLPF